MRANFPSAPRLRSEGTAAAAVVQSVAKPRARAVFVPAVKALVSAGLLAYLLSRISLHDVVAAAAATSVLGYAAVALGLLVFLLLGTWRVYQIVRVFAPISFIHVLGMYWVSVAFGAFTPGQLGELSLAYFLSRRGLDSSASLAISAVDRVTTLATLVLLAAMGLVLYVPEGTGWWLWSLVLTLVLGATGLFVRPWRKAVRRVVERVAPGAIPFLEAFCRFFLAHPGRAAFNLLLGFARWVCAAFMLLVIIVPLAPAPVSWTFVVVANAVARLVTYVPVSINGLGVLELSAVELFRGGGIPADLTLTAFIVNRIIYYMFAVAMVLVWLWRHPRPQSEYSEKPAALNRPS